MTNRGPKPWQEIGDRVWVRRYEFLDQTIGAIGGADGLLVVDSRSSHRQAAELEADTRALGLDVRWVVNTHRHWDHAFGNARFARAELWGHDRCASGMLEDGEIVRAELIEEMPERADEWREVVITPPRCLFAERATIDLGGRPVELRYLGRGHTDGDIVLLVPDADVLFGGDLVENGGPPSFGDSFPLDWPATVQSLLGLVSGPVAPGHGDVGDRTFVLRQIEELSEVAALGRSVAAGESSLDDALARGPYGPERNRHAIERAVAQARGALD
jgi:glyoxylase-like metal-dependent hydrolase (beta-lactamase superfamily II)